MVTTGLLADWMMQARCLDMPIHYFFPETSSNRRALTFTYQEERAKAICVRCPVRRECLLFAVTPQDYGLMWNTGEHRYVRYQPEGVWGGTLPRERSEHWSEDTEGMVDKLLELMEEQAKERGLV